MPGIDRFNLEGKTVLITGGASRYGRHLVRDISLAGATVVMTSRDKDRALETAKALRGPNSEVKTETLDLTDHGSIRNLTGRLQNDYDSIDGLVNNAVARPMDDLDDDIEQWQESMIANATGVFELTRIVADWMARTTGGSIVNVGSIQGMVGPDETLYEGVESYNDSDYPPPDYFYHKSGLLNLTRYFASVFGEDDVRVNTVSPGGIRQEDQDESFVRNYEQKTMLGRLADGEDLSGLVVYLLSDASSYVTAANIPVDGGYTAK